MILQSVYIDRYSGILILFIFTEDVANDDQKQNYNDPSDTDTVTGNDEYNDDPPYPFLIID